MQPQESKQTTLRYQHQEVVREIISQYEPATLEELLRDARETVKQLQVAGRSFQDGTKNRALIGAKTPESTKQYETIINSYLGNLVETTRQFYQQILTYRAVVAGQLLDWKDMRDLEMQLRNQGPPLEIPGR